MTVLLIDGDVMCYHACPRRWEKTKQVVGNAERVVLGLDGKPVPFEYTPEEDQAYLELCYRTLQKNLEELMETLFAVDYMAAVKSPTNFRADMYPEYKLKRGAYSSPGGVRDFVPKLRTYFVKELGAVYAYDREADDLIRIWAQQAMLIGDDYIVCTNDKDLKCIPGRYYDLQKKELVVITPEDARRRYYEQLLMGDGVDNIPGIPGLGPKTAAKRLAHCKTHEEFQEVVVGEYVAQYQDEWANMLLSNGKMIHLQRHPEDYFSLADWPLAKELR